MVKQVLFLVFLSITSYLESRLYFIHIPKTGGTTLRYLLEKEVDSEDMYPYRNPKTGTFPVEQEIISGHFPYSHCRKIDAEFDNAFKITILRDPIERYISFLQAKKRNEPHLPTLEAVMDLGMAPNSKYHDNLIDNALCRNLAKEPGLEGKELLASAKKTLHEFDEIIFFDRYNEEVIALFQRLGVSLQKEDIPQLNPSPKAFVSEKLLAKIQCLNQLDKELYEYAKNFYVKSKKTYKLRSEKYENLLKPKDEIHYTFDQPLNGRNWTYRDTSNDKAISPPTYRWVTDAPAFINFFLEEDADYDLFFTARPISFGLFPEVKVNGESIPISQINHAVFSLYHGIIPRQLIQKQPVEISFFSAKSFAYKDTYSSGYHQNPPRVSFALNQIIIKKRKLL